MDCIVEGVKRSPMLTDFHFQGKGGTSYTLKGYHKEDVCGDGINPYLDCDGSLRNLHGEKFI